MSTIHVKYGLEFKPELYRSNNRDAWLEAVGAELEKKGVSLQLGVNTPIEIKNTQDLKAFYQRYGSQPDQMAQDLGLQPGQNVQRYLRDLIQTLDDIVKPSSDVKTGTTLDLRPTSEMSKMLGLDDSSHRYASSRTGFGESTKTNKSVSVLGVMLSRDAVPVDPLAGQLYIDSATFSGQTLKTDRNNHEFEAVRRLGGMDKEQLIEFLRTERNGRPIVNRVRKAKDAEAFSIGYSGITMDKMRWDSEAHRVREGNPYVSLTVESGRLEANEQGEYEVQLGTDYNEDAYYDTKDFTLLNNEMSVRTRIRRDDPDPGNDAVRRILIQSKAGSSVDESGTKSAAKADIRKDSPTAEDVANLDADIRTGMSEWGWNRTSEPIEAIGIVHKDLAERGLLPTIGEHKDVLQLEAKAHVRSTRSRFHFNETSRQSTVSLFREAGEPNIKRVLEWVKTSQTLKPEDSEKLNKLGQSLLDKSVILERTQDALMALDPALKQNGVTLDTINQLWPDKEITSDKLDTQKRRVVADALKSTMNEFATLVDDLRRDIAGARGDGARGLNLTSEFVEYIKEKDTSTRSVTTIQPFLDRLDKELSGPNKQAFIDDFAQWAGDKGNKAILDAPDKEAAMGGLRKHLVNEQLDIIHRQLEASGTMGQTLWFDSARKAYADSSRSYGNFLIDTFDVSEMYKPEVWKTLTDAQKAGAEPVDPKQMFHATIVNEVQIELRSEEPFLKAIAAAEKILKSDRASVVMDFALAQGLPVIADQPASFAQWLGELQKQPTDQQKQVLDQLQTFASEKGSPLTFSMADLQKLDDSLFTADRQGQNYAAQAGHLDDLNMAQFVWSKMLGTQEYVANLRGRRVEQEAERAGFSGVKWENSEMSKGDTALTLLRDGNF